MNSQSSLLLTRSDSGPYYMRTEKLFQKSIKLWRRWQQISLQRTDDDLVIKFSFLYAVPFIIMAGYIASDVETKILKYSFILKKTKVRIY